ncbi:MAG: hypothetical protein GY847_27745 [Proteobacteria bacterium]|nr:hypothetical protein [Pseudomonadota bacterium]
MKHPKKDLVGNLKALLKDPEQTLTSFKAALALLLRADNELKAWPSMKQLAEDTGLSDRGIQKGRELLRDKEQLIEHKSQKLPNGKVARRDRIVYQLVISPKSRKKNPNIGEQRSHEHHSAESYSPFERNLVRADGEQRSPACLEKKKKRKEKVRRKGGPPKKIFTYSDISKATVTQMSSSLDSAPQDIPPLQSRVAESITKQWPDYQDKDAILTAQIVLQYAETFDFEELLRRAREKWGPNRAMYDNKNGLHGYIVSWFQNEIEKREKATEGKQIACPGYGDLELKIRNIR